MYISFKEFVGIIVKTLFIILVFVGSCYLITFNIDFANYLCKITNIPKDLALTIMSPGYANEIIIILTIIEISVLSYFMNKISKTRLFNILYDKLYY